jgi:hypothetical protein
MLFFFFLVVVVLFSETGPSCYVAQDVLELVSLLPQLPEC